MSKIGERNRAQNGSLPATDRGSVAEKPRVYVPPTYQTETIQHSATRYKDVWKTESYQYQPPSYPVTQTHTQTKVISQYLQETQVTPVAGGTTVKQPITGKCPVPTTS
ncbi:hypothetical protein [Sulfobacillus thermosulfidooxidans]|uniref:hypothetical protein n=1 Tax=Sulfobacillus thermosulfidooxidans TaxID=28034 RepID=UPI0006B46DDD|nr:hypothetical protein [Sulfobacillus thermosulfidooxidans]